MWENIIWAVFFGLPFAIGCVAMSLTPPDFTIARIGFLVAAMVLLGRICWWISVEHQFGNKGLIIISTSLAFLFIGLCLGCGLYWLESREKIAKQIEDKSKEAKPPIAQESHFPFVNVDFERVKAELPFENLQIQPAYDIFLHNKSSVVLSRVRVRRVINPEKNKQKIALSAHSQGRLKSFDEPINVLSPGEKRKIYREHSQSYEYMVITVTYADDSGNKYECIFEGDKNGVLLKNHRPIK